LVVPARRLLRRESGAAYGGDFEAKTGQNQPTERPQTAQPTGVPLRRDLGLDRFG
jgi:hypothetical protein